MSRSRFRAALLLFFGAAVLAADFAAGQDPLPGFGEVVDVRVVNLEVVVTDRRGNRVPDLRLGEFVLLVDGRETPIEFFSEVRDGEILVPEGPADATVPSRHGLPADARGRVATHYLVFVDDLYTVGAKKRLVVDRLRRQLDLLEPQDRMAVYGFDGRRLRFYTGWTGARRVLDRALAEAADATAYGPLRQYQPLGTFDSLVGAMTAGLRSAGAPVGRKVLLLLAGKWGFLPGLFNKPRNVGRFFRDASPLMPLVDAAKDLGYSLYPVDVGGLGPSGPGVGAERPVVRAGYQISSELLIDAQLLFLSRETGGRAALNTLRLDALGRTREDTRSYYWLGFGYDARGDDRRHRVRVKVKRQGLKARTRRDFVDFSQRTHARNLVWAGLLLDADHPLPNQHLEISAGQGRVVDRDRLEIPVRVDIPMDRITRLPAGETVEARVEVGLGVRDAKGLLSDYHWETVRLRLENPERASEAARYRRSVTVRRQPHDMVVVVHDQPSGELLSGRAVLEP